MVDFRYHLVSLVAVFLALAVGIVLGAGPLQQPIGESLQGQVDDLRKDRDTLRDQNEAKGSDVSDLNNFVVATAPRLLHGTLKHKTIALLRANGSDSKQIDAVENRLGESGAKVVQAGVLTGKRLDREDAAQTTRRLRSSDPTLPKEPARALPLALARAIGHGHGQAKSVTAKQSKAMQRTLARAGVLRTGEQRSANAAVVVLADPQGQAAPATKSAAGSGLQLGSARTTAADTARMFPTVAIGPRSAAKQGVLAKLRSREPAISTVDALDLDAGPVISAMVVADRLAGGKPNSYGFGSQTEMMAPGLSH